MAFRASMPKGAQRREKQAGWGGSPKGRNHQPGKPPRSGERRGRQSRLARGQRDFGFDLPGQKRKTTRKASPARPLPAEPARVARATGRSWGCRGLAPCPAGSEFVPSPIEAKGGLRGGHSTICERSEWSNGGGFIAPGSRPAQPLICEPKASGGAESGWGRSPWPRGTWARGFGSSDARPKAPCPRA